MKAPPRGESSVADIDYGGWRLKRTLDPADPRSVRSCRPPSLKAQAGFTIVEVAVASLMLIVGVLGTVALIDSANARTSSTRSQEAATNLGRELTEAARSIPFARLLSSPIEQELQAKPGLGDSRPSQPGWQIDRRDNTYQVTATSRRVFGNNVSVDVRVTWARGSGTREVRQGTLVSNPAGVDDPAISVLKKTSPLPEDNLTVTSGSQVEFSATTQRAVPTVTWSVDGANLAEARNVASGTSWGFTWVVTAPDGTETVDGPYLIGAQAFDEAGSGGVPKVLTVTLNRALPHAPLAFAAGRNGPVVELEWLPNRERDILGYRVYRKVTEEGGQSSVTLTCETTGETTCVDESPPAPGSGADLRYYVVALDPDPSTDEPREGLRTAEKDISDNNSPPNPPRDARSSTGGGTPLSWLAPDPADPDTGDSVSFYRVYRDGERYARTNAFDPTTRRFTWSDPNPGEVTHSYAVTAVDTNMAESQRVDFP